MSCELFYDVESIHSNPDLLQKEKDLFRSQNYLGIYLLTFNVNGKEPDDVNFSELLAWNHLLYDVYAIVLEELPVKSLLWMNPWSYELEQRFQKKNYVLLKKESVVFTEVLIFVRKRDLMKYSKVRSHSVKNINGLSFKGGSGIRFVYDKIKIAFLGAHLTPHDENYGQRLKDLYHLFSEIDFGEHVEMINNQDVTFILGDLNFRLNPLNIAVPEEESEFDYIERFIREHRNDTNPKRYEPLFQFDQIRYAMRKGESFQGYEESPITFAPTFKFIIGTCDYDDKRRPAWTDRILHRNLLKIQFKDAQKQIDLNDRNIDPIMLYYNSLSQFKISDHKPVRQVAWIPIKDMLQTKLDLLRIRRQRKRKSLDAKRIKNPYPKGRMLQDNYSEEPLSLTSDSVAWYPAPPPNPLNRSGSSSSTSSSSSGEWIAPSIESALESMYWPNIDDGELFQRRYRIEFYHIPDWCQTRKYKANFRIVLDEDQITDNVSDEDDDNVTEHYGDENIMGSARTANKQNTNRPSVSIHSPSVKKYLSVWDWVGLFPEQYTSMQDFLTYSYPKFGSALPTEEAHDALTMMTIQDPSLSSIEHHPPTQTPESPPRPKPSQPLVNEPKAIQKIENVLATSPADSARNETQDVSDTSSTTTNTDDVLTVHFDESCSIRAGRYLLIYVRANGDVIGVSEPFQISQDLDLNSAL